MVSFSGFFLRDSQSEIIGIAAAENSANERQRVSLASRLRQGYGGQGGADCELTRACPP